MQLIYRIGWQGGIPFAIFQMFSPPYPTTRFFKIGPIDLPLHYILLERS